MNTANTDWMNPIFDLKPCPFCGGKALLNNSQKGVMVALCTGCSANMVVMQRSDDNLFNTMKITAEKWNQRVIPQPLTREIVTPYDD